MKSGFVDRVSKDFDFDYRFSDKDFHELIIREECKSEVFRQGCSQGFGYFLVI